MPNWLRLSLTKNLSLADRNNAGLHLTNAMRDDNNNQSDASTLIKYAIASQEHLIPWIKEQSNNHLLKDFLFLSVLEGKSSKDLAVDAPENIKNKPLTINSVKTWVYFIFALAISLLSVKYLPIVISYLNDISKIINPPKLLTTANIFLNFSVLLYLFIPFILNSWQSKTCTNIKRNNALIWSCYGIVIVLEIMLISLQSVTESQLATQRLILSITAIPSMYLLALLMTRCELKFAKNKPGFVAICYEQTFFSPSVLLFVATIFIGTLIILIDEPFIKMSSPNLISLYSLEYWIMPLVLIMVFNKRLQVDFLEYRHLLGVLFLMTVISANFYFAADIISDVFQETKSATYVLNDKLSYLAEFFDSLIFWTTLIIIASNARRLAFKITIIPFVVTIFIQHLLNYIIDLEKFSTLLSADLSLFLYSLFNGIAIIIGLSIFKKMANSQLSFNLRAMLGIPFVKLYGSVMLTSCAIGIIRSISSSYEWEQWLTLNNSVDGIGYYCIDAFTSLLIWLTFYAAFAKPFRESIRKIRQKESPIKASLWQKFCYVCNSNRTLNHLSCNNCGRSSPVINFVNRGRLVYYILLILIINSCSYLLAIAETSSIQNILLISLLISMITFMMNTKSKIFIIPMFFIIGLISQFIPLPFGDIITKTSQQGINSVLPLYKDITCSGYIECTSSITTLGLFLYAIILCALFGFSSSGSRFIQQLANPVSPNVLWRRFTTFYLLSSSIFTFLWVNYYPNIGTIEFLIYGLIMAFVILMTQYLLYFLKVFLLSLFVFLFLLLVVLNIYLFDSPGAITNTISSIYGTFLLGMAWLLFLRTKHLKIRLIKAADRLYGNSSNIQRILAQKHLDEVSIIKSMDQIKLSLKDIHQLCDRPCILWGDNHKQVAEFANIAKQWTLIWDVRFNVKTIAGYFQFLHAFKQDIEPNLYKLIIACRPAPESDMPHQKATVSMPS
ncbi:MAG: hypothetical protein HRU40_20050 [Saprospiraceae bacterium]|nr:hypothetical protein [Saprospiraceae bacterium]